MPLPIIAPLLAGAGLGSFNKDFRNWFSTTVDSLTGKASTDISNKNLNFQKEQSEYEQQLQQQIFEREDTAYQRAVRDARSAGLSALSVNSGSSAGEVVSTSAPQQQDTSQVGFANGMNMLNMFNSVVSNLGNLKIQSNLASSQIAKENAETIKTLEEANNARLSNPITRKILNQNLTSLMNRNELNSFAMPFYKDYLEWDHLDKKNIQLYNDWYGLNSSMQPIERLMAMGLNGGYQFPNSDYNPPYPFASFNGKNTYRHYLHDDGRHNFPAQSYRDYGFYKGNDWDNEVWNNEARKQVEKGSALNQLFPSLMSNFGGLLLQSLIGF